MFKDISFYNKIISLILLVIALVLVQNYSVFLLICGLVLVLAFINKKIGLLIVNIINFALVYFLGSDPTLFVVFKFILPIIYIFVIEDSLYIVEKRFLYDSLFYRNRSKVKDYMKKYYWDKCYEKNMGNLDQVTKYLDNSRDVRKFKGYIEDEAYDKTKKDINRKYLIDKIRYDRYFTKKRNFLINEWGLNDTFFLGLNIAVLLLVVFLGR